MWWDKKYGKNSICSITKTRLRPGKNKHGQSYSVYLNCGHGFYRSALTKWVLANPLEIPTCPSCRKYFDPLIVFISY